MSGDVPLYYEEHGDGEPLLLIPGLGCSVEIYRANTPALTRRFRVIIFDPRGAGRSATTEDGYTMQAYADDAAAVLRAAEVESAHVLGTSFGGMIALNLALQHPQCVRHLVLACTTPGGTAHVAPPVENLATFLAASREPDPAVSTRMRYPLHYSDAYIAAHDEEIVAHSIATSHLGPTPRGREGQLEAVRTHDTVDRLSAITAPTFVAHGDEDGVIPVPNARTLAERIRGTRLKVYDGAKHIFFVERADEFNADVIAFLSGGTLNER
jgi:pimeloyl-ACP methyl ester carboxylesterase